MSSRTNNEESSDTHAYSVTSSAGASVEYTFKVINCHSWFCCQRLPVTRASKQWWNPKSIYRLTLKNR